MACHPIWHDIHPFYARLITLSNGYIGFFVLNLDKKMTSYATIYIYDMYDIINEK